MNKQERQKPTWLYCTAFDAIPWSSNSGNNMIRLSYVIRGVSRVIDGGPIREWVNPETTLRHPLGKKFRERARFFGMADELSIDQALRMFQRARSPDWIKVAPSAKKYHNILELAYDETPPNNDDEWEF